MDSTKRVGFGHCQSRRASMLSTGKPRFSQTDRSSLESAKFEGVPPLDKLPTNKFVENYLENDLDDSDEKESQHTQTSSMRNATAKFVAPLPEEADEVETNIDIQEKMLAYDDTGQKAYENACKHYQALPCSTFWKSLQDSSHINLSNYNLGPRGATALCIPLVINTKVTSLNLSANGLSKKGLKYLGKMMVENESITELNVSENNMKTAGAIVLADILKHNNTLQVLDMSKNSFTDKDAELLTKPIETHQKLRTLIMSENNFGEVSAPLFRNMISENGHLAELDLSWNHFRNQGAVDICNGIRDNIGLKVFKVAWNGLGEKGATAMSVALKTSTVTHLDLTNNRIGPQGFLLLVKSLKENDVLKEMDLSKNPIPEDAASAALEFINSKMDDLHLEKLILGDILYSSKFATLVAQVQEKFTNFTCQSGYSDLYGKRRMKEYNLVEEAMLAIRKYCDSHNTKIVDLFARFDADGSMSVSHEEFKIGLREARVPVSDEQIKELIKTLDQDNDGEIDFSEMVMGAELYKEST